MIFSNESLDYLISTGEHCIHKDYIKYLTEEKPKIANKKKRDYKIGIIIPNYNYGEWIEKCLNSISADLMNINGAMIVLCVFLGLL